VRPGGVCGCLIGVKLLTMGSFIGKNQAVPLGSLYEAGSQRQSYLWVDLGRSGRTVGAVMVKVETLKKPRNTENSSLIAKWKDQAYGENLQKPKISIRASRPYDLDAKLKGAEKGQDVNIFPGVNGRFSHVERLASADTP